MARDGRGGWLDYAFDMLDTKTSKVVIIQILAKMVCFASPQSSG
jgi:hypothetical protein